VGAVEPERACARDAHAVAHYRAVLAAAREAGVAPWACLHHFTLRWFAADGGFLHAKNRLGAWTRHVDWVAETFCDLVAGWQPVNETNFYPLGATAALAFRRHDRAEWAAATEELHLATAEAAVGPSRPARRSSIYALAPPVAQDDSAETRRTSSGSTRSTGPPGSTCSATACRAPGRRSSAPTRGRVRLDRLLVLLGAGVRAAAPRGIRLTRRSHRSGTHLARRPGARAGAIARGASGTPLLVAEFGIGTDDARCAPRTGARLAIARRRPACGIDVRGFFHWTGVDNYEWLRGYDRVRHHRPEPEARPSAEVLRRERAARADREQIRARR
jgi:beta-glucosidase